MAKSIDGKKYNLKPSGKLDTGRPPLFNTKEELEKKIEEYFLSIEPKPLQIDGEIIYNKDGSPCMELRIPTVCGLALYLGFSTRQSMADYKENPVFSYSINKAITSIEKYNEEQLTINSKPVGAIFWLKNHGWKDKTEQEVTLSEPKIIDDIE